MTRFILTIFTLLGLSGCATDSDRPTPDPDPDPTLARLELGAETRTLDPGTSMQLVARAFDRDGAPMTVPPLTWTSSDNTIISVGSGGRVTAASAGAVRIAARSGSIEGSIALTAREVISPVHEVRIEPGGEIVLGRGRTAQLAATAYDENGEVLPGRAIIWTSENGGIALISDSGMLTAIAAGSTTIRAHSEGRFADAAIRITIPVARVSLDADSLTLQPGNTRRLTATAFADDNTQIEDRAASWASTDTSVASVDAQGLVTAHARGTTQVIATIEGVAAELALTVTAVGRIQLNYETATIAVDEQLQLVATLYDLDGKPMQGYVAWSVDRPEQLYVDSSGLATARMEGSAIVTATSGGVRATATVFVTRWDEHMLATVNGAALPATLYEYTTNIGGTNRQLRMQADDGVLAIRWLDNRYEMAVFGPVFVDGVESSYHMHTSVGSVAWDSTAQVFRFTPDSNGPMFTGRYVGSDMQIVWQPDPKGAPATLVFAKG